MLPVNTENIQSMWTIEVKKKSIWISYGKGLCLKRPTIIFASLNYVFSTDRESKLEYYKIIRDQKEKERIEEHDRLYEEYIEGNISLLSIIP